MAKIMENYKSLFLFLLLIYTAVSCIHNPEQLNKNDSVVFLSNRESPKGEFDIFTMKIDGTYQTNLTNEIGSIRSISNPLISPDGKSVLYTSFNRGGRFLHILDIAKKKDKYLVNVNLDNPSASFIENGTKILYVKKIRGRKQIFIINTNGDNERNISSSSNDEYNPKFSNDNKRLVFVRSVNKKLSIVTRSLNSNDENSFELKGNRINPAFVNNNDIIYESFVDDSYKIYMFDHESKQHTLLPTGNSNAYYPKPALNNEYILFLSDARGMKYKDVCLLNLKTKKYKILTNRLNTINQNTSLSSDGKKVVFESIKYNDSEIYLLDLNDNKLLNLTNNLAWDCQPSF